MEIIFKRKNESLRAILGFVFLGLSFLQANEFPACGSMLRSEGNFSGTGPGLDDVSQRVARLPFATDPYGRNLPREEHETERAGQLYPMGAKFNSRLDEKGNLRPDGRYLFVIARDRLGNRRIMVVPRFEFDKKDGKFLNTHRSMFRKFPDVFGPNPYAEVMGELEILGGTVVAYNNKAGTAFDKNEASQPDLFHQRVDVAESMGIDLSKSLNTVNYSIIAEAKTREEAHIPGRHLEEEDYIKVAKLFRDNPVSKRLIDHYRFLTEKLYKLFPEETAKHPTVPFDTEKIQAPPFNFSFEEAASIKLYMHSAQLDGPEAFLARGFSRDTSGATLHAKMLDQLEYIIQVEEATRLGKSVTTNRPTQQGHYEKQNKEDIALGRYDRLHKDIKNVMNHQTLAEVDTDFSWKVDKEYQQLFDDEFMREQLFSAQTLMTELRKRYGDTQERGAPVDFSRLSKNLKLDEEDGFLDEPIAQRMVYDLLIESEKKDGNPVKLFVEMHKRAESATEDEISSHPYPGIVIFSFLRTLGVTR